MRGGRDRPRRVHRSIASLDEASGGRAIMGIGAGGSGFRQLGLTRTKPAVAVRELIELMRRLWRGEEFEFEGRIINWKRGALEFECRPDIPVVIAARGPFLLELAGEVADGAIVASGVSPGGVAWARELIARGEARAGRQQGQTELLHMTYISIDEYLASRARQSRKRLSARWSAAIPTSRLPEGKRARDPPRPFCVSGLRWIRGCTNH